MTTHDSGASGPLAELAAVAHLIGSTTVDGVPVLFARSDGPAAAGLIARVGWADEPLARAGITHLVEHLALHRQNLTDVHLNGATSDTSTHFHASGTPAELVAFLNGLCASLRDLPVHRIEAEKDILMTESSSRGSGFADHQRLERYGARGPGLAVYDSYGLAAVSAEDVLEWARTRFTRENVVVWMTTEGVPDGLDLRLPAGERRPVPEWAEITPNGPSYFVGRSGGMLVDAVVPRSFAAMVYARVASKALFRALRQEGGLSYTARCDYEPIDAERARISVFADALADKQAAVVGGVVDVLARIRAGVIDESDLASARAGMRHPAEVPFLGAAMLVPTAVNLLEGREIDDPERAFREHEAVTATEVVAVAESVWRGALAQVPEGALDWAGFDAVPTCSAIGVGGRVHPQLGGGGALVLGQRGVTLRLETGPVTVLFDDCQALECWPDGGRCLTGSDGFRVRVEPTLYADLGPAAIASIDAAVPPERHIARPARAAESIPQPVAPVASPPRTSTSVVLGFAALALMILTVLAVGFTVTSALHLETPFADGTVASVGSVVVGTIASCVMLVAAAALLVFVRIRARRSGARL